MKHPQLPTAEAGGAAAGAGDAARNILETAPPPAAVLAATPASAVEEATMEEHFVWMTTRRIKPGTLTEFERAWRPDTHPEGMLRAYAYWSENGEQIIGVSSWVSRQSYEAWRASEAEERRRAAMAPYILDEQEGFYRGRELVVPAR
ncbi:MAG TPA: antibiotic biosynthesis monooxygenase [Streptosporangiaceae bacterium]